MSSRRASARARTGCCAAVAAAVLLALVAGLFVQQRALPWQRAGPAPVASVVPGPPTPQLPFDMPSTATLRALPRKVFAHYWTPLPI